MKSSLLPLCLLLACSLAAQDTTGILDTFEKELEATETGTAEAEAKSKVASAPISPIQAALEKLDIVAGRFPDDPALLHQLIIHLTNAGRTAEATVAAVHLEQNPGDIPAADRVFLRHQLQFSLRDFDEALRIIRVLSKSEPDSYRVQFSEAQCLFLLYRFDEAEKAIEKLVLDNPRADSSFSNLLDFQRYACLAKLGKAESKEAIALVERYDYLSKDPVWYAKEAMLAFEAGKNADGLAWMRSIEQIYSRRVASLYLDCFYELGYLPHWQYPDRAPFNADVASMTTPGQ